jgi:ubiquitin-activating enzyme E1
MAKDAPLDANLSVADFEKLHHLDLSHIAFAALDTFMQEHKGQKPAAWSLSDAAGFLKIANKIKETKFEDAKLLLQFALTSRGVFNPLCAFFGGFVAQEAIKAITGKFSPTQ